MNSARIAVLVLLVVFSITLVLATHFAIQAEDRPERRAWQAQDPPAAVMRLLETGMFSPLQLVQIPGGDVTGQPVAKNIMAVGFYPELTLNKVGSTNGTPALKPRFVAKLSSPMPFKNRRSSFPMVLKSNQDGTGLKLAPVQSRLNPELNTNLYKVTEQGLKPVSNGSIAGKGLATVGGATDKFAIVLTPLTTLPSTKGRSMRPMANIQATSSQKMRFKSAIQDALMKQRGARNIQKLLPGTFDGFDVAAFRFQVGVKNGKVRSFDIVAQSVDR